MLYLYHPIAGNNVNPGDIDHRGRGVAVKVPVVVMEDEGLVLDRSIIEGEATLLGVMMPGMSLNPLARCAVGNTPQTGVEAAVRNDDVLILEAYVFVVYL